MEEREENTIRNEVKTLIDKHGGLEPVIKILMETATNENRNNISIRLEAMRVLVELLNCAK